MDPVDYIGFLNEQLPRLASVAHYSPGERIHGRGVVLVDAISKAPPGVCLEFGVYNGASITNCGNIYKERSFFGFDSFEGFPEDGRTDWNDDFSVAKLPEVPPNVALIKGWFRNTLGPFLKDLKEPVGFVNIDCDLYSSTNDVFDELLAHGHFRPGLVISFDELINYGRYPWNEMLSLYEHVSAAGLSFEWVGVHQHVRLIGETIRLLETSRHPGFAEDTENGYRHQAAIRLTEGPLIGPSLTSGHVRRRVENLAERFTALTR